MGQGCVAGAGCAQRQGPGRAALRCAAGKPRGFQRSGAVAAGGESGAAKRPAATGGLHFT